MYGLSLDTARQFGRVMTESVQASRYAELFGPTTGDRVRLADTDLFVEITEDRSGGPGLAGDEAVFGGGKVLRESMGRAARPGRRRTGHGHHRCGNHRPLGNHQGRRRDS